MKKRKMKTRKISLQNKIRLQTMLLSMLAIVLISAIALWTMERFLMERSKSHVKAIAEIAANMIDGEKHDSIQPGEEDGENYQEIYTILRKCLESDGVDYIYTMKYLNGKELQFVVDADASDEKAMIGDVYSETCDEMYQALEGKVTVDSSITKDEWGSYISAYAPIYNNSGNVIGLVGADCEVSEIYNNLMELVKYLFLGAVAAIIIEIIIALFSGKLLVKNIYYLNDRIMDIAYNDGDLTKKLFMSSGDELEVIGKHFNALLEKNRSAIAQVKFAAETLLNSFKNTKEMTGKTAEKTGTIMETIQDAKENMIKNTKVLKEVDTSVASAKKEIGEMSEDAKICADEVMEIYRRAQRSRNETLKMQEKMHVKRNNMKKLVDEKIEQSLSVNKIHELTEDILNIAEETDLLALNASIEAARAGEYGKGFLIVAEEIAALSSKTGSAAIEIQDLSKKVIYVVDELAKVSEEMLSVMEESISRTMKEFADTEEEYCQDAEKLNVRINQFKIITNKLQKTMVFISETVSNVSISSEEKKEQLQEVAEISLLLYNDMEYLDKEMHQNEVIAEDMETVVNQYQV